MLRSALLLLLFRWLSTASLLATLSLYFLPLLKMVELPSKLQKQGRNEINCTQFIRHSTNKIPYILTNISPNIIYLPA